MKNHYLYFGLSLLCATTLQAQNYCTPENEADSLFLGYQLDGNGDPIPVIKETVLYAQQVFSIDEWDNSWGCGWANQCENLGLDVYYPDLPAGEKRPLVVLIHGGAFITGNRTDYAAMAEDLAKRGYIAATIDYRLCKRNNCNGLEWLSEFLPVWSLICNLNFWNDFGQSAYVATIDAHNAIRYLQDHAAEFHIDPENIIVGGHSAGGWLAEHVAFLDQDEANALAGGNNYEALWDTLGPVTGIKGVFNLAGAMLDTTHIDEDEHIPTFFVTGTCDPVICYGYDAPFHCNNSYPKVHGGSELALRMHHLGHSYYLFTGEYMGHDVNILNDTWMPELLQFAYNAMLCDSCIQEHRVEQLDLNNPDCAILSNPAILQAAHDPLPPINMPLYNCLVDATEPIQNTKTRIYPVPVSGTYLQLEPEDARLISAYNLMGQPASVHQEVPGRLRIDESAGIYFLLIELPDGKREVLKIVVQ